MHSTKASFRPGPFVFLLAALAFGVGLPALAGTAFATSVRLQFSMQGTPPDSVFIIARSPDGAFEQTWALRYSSEIRIDVGAPPGELEIEARDSGGRRAFTSVDVSEAPAPRRHFAKGGGGGGGRVTKSGGGAGKKAGAAVVTIRLAWPAMMAERRDGGGGAAAAAPAAPPSAPQSAPQSARSPTHAMPPADEGLDWQQVFFATDRL